MSISEQWQKIIRFCEDQILAFLQRRCDHPGEMVAADKLEGCVDNLQVKHCRRCGALKMQWRPDDPKHQFIILDHTWDIPDPNLWRG